MHTYGFRGEAVSAICSVAKVVMITRHSSDKIGNLKKIFYDYTVKPQFTGPLGGKELGPVNREARYIRVHFKLIYT